MGYDMIISRKVTVKLHVEPEPMPRVNLDRWLRANAPSFDDIVDEWGWDDRGGMWIEYRQDWEHVAAVFRREMGIKTLALISAEDANSKLELSMGQGIAVTSLSLAAESVEVDVAFDPYPTRLVTCNHAHRGKGGCADTCLVFSGRNPMTIPESARQRRTQLLYNYPKVFFTIYIDNLRVAYNRHWRKGLRSVHRPNCMSDQRWEKAVRWMFDLFAAPELGNGPMQFIDYTKWRPSQRLELPNYTMAYSAWNGQDELQDVLALHQAGHNVAMIIDDMDLLLGFAPEGWFVDAVAGDHWMLEAREDDRATIGLLKPKFPMPEDYPAVYRAAEVYGHLAF